MAKRPVRRGARKKRTRAPRPQTAARGESPSPERPGRGGTRSRPSRLEQFRRAHEWRLALVELAKQRDLTVGDLTARGTRTRALKDLAAAVSAKVGFEVSYHTVWRFSRRYYLFSAYMRGEPPTPEEQLAAASADAFGAGRGHWHHGGAGLEGRFEELRALGGELDAVAKRVRIAVQALAAALRAEDDLKRLLAASLEMVSGRR